MTLRGAISVDLDSLRHYCRIQGVPEDVLSDEARALVSTKAVPRLMELSQEVGCPMTLFVIASDLVADPLLQDALRSAVASGAELASHSDSHDYAISRWSRADIDADLLRAHQRITEVAGAAPVGFRAPGYTLSSALLSSVAAMGYRYDSSAFPAAPYYLAKAAVMGALELLRRPSRAILDTPAVLRAPRVPYRPSLEKPYRAGTAPLIELPMSVTPTAHLPFIGTFVTSAPWPVVQACLGALEGDGLVNFELHAIDFLDVSDGIPERLAAQQRDARIPYSVKRRRLRTVFSALKQARAMGTLAEVASALAPRPYRSAEAPP